MIEGHGDELYKYGKKIVSNFSSNVYNRIDHSGLYQRLNERLSTICSYPEPMPYSLESEIARRYSLTPRQVCVTNGATEAIYLIAQVFQGRISAVLGPTFSEYADACRVHRHKVKPFYSLDALPEDAELVWICNPNNPTSSAIMQEDLRKLIAFCADKDIFVMIDETYVEFAPDVEEITAIPLTREFTNLMVLRGVSKFYAAPGMRLGYGITGNMEFLSKMREKQTPWSLNSLGAFAGELMLRDHDYIQETRDLILDERDRMEQELQNIPTFKVYPAYANFILLKIRRDGLTSADVFEACIKKGLMIRDCSSFQCLDGEFVRFCIMMHDDNTKLLNVLKQL